MKKTTDFFYFIALNKVLLKNTMSGSSTANPVTDAGNTGRINRNKKRCGEY